MVGKLGCQVYAPLMGGVAVFGCVWYYIYAILEKVENTFLTFSLLF
jgi:hypothetical protein